MPLSLNTVKFDVNRVKLVVNTGKPFRKGRFELKHGVSSKRILVCTKLLGARSPAIACGNAVAGHCVSARKRNSVFRR